MPEPILSGVFPHETAGPPTDPSIVVEARQGYFALMVNRQLVAAWQNRVTADLAAKNLRAALAGAPVATADAS